MLEAGDIQEGDDEGASLRIEDFRRANVNDGGILTGSTLQALKGYTADSSGAARKAPGTTGGALVGYGSDEDSD